MNILYIFDVDGVICDRGQKIEPEFKQWFLDWTNNRNFYYLTGSGREKTIDQLGNDLVTKTRISYHCLANNIWIDDREVCINQFTLKNDELDFLEDYVKNSTFGTKTGHHIDFRKGSINFSVVGKNASESARKSYQLFDETNKDREKFIKLFTAKFPRFEAYKGGDVSVDICLHSCNKSQVLTLLPPHDKLFFFGDRCRYGGIDYPLARMFTEANYQDVQSNINDRYKWKYFQIDNGYKQTWDILKLL
jgi:hydroxymethylpyrimidine pyrophosphatase-like HAD family hydrolase